MGLAGSGKSTVFTAVSRHVASHGKESQAVVEVPDERIDRLVEIYDSKKVVHAQVRLIDVAGIDARALGQARAADALAIVLRAFGPDADPVRDLDSFRAELAVADLTTVEKVRERSSRQSKGGDATTKLEAELAGRAEAVLSDGRWLSDEPWSPDELRVLSMWTPLTFKPALHVINAEEPDAPVADIPEPRVVLCGALEAEATDLDEADAAELLSGFGISEPGAARFIRAAYDAIGLLTFFTAGPTEAHAWEVRRGAKAPQAAGVIHSDFEKGFIRAERVAYDDLDEAGSEEVARQRGLVRMEGKEYEVREGDILVILHS